MTTAAQFEWTEDRNPEAGEFTSSRKPWNAITEFTFNDLDHNGKPFDLAQVLDGERLNLAAHKGAAEYTVVSVDDRTVTVAAIYGYGDPIPGTVTTITTRAEGDFDYDDTALIARIAAEEKKRAEEDALLQGQIDGKADKDHDHPDLEVGDHNHDTDYAPKTHDHNQYSPLGHGHSEFTHDHDTDYAPTVHDHPHGHTEFQALEEKDAEQDQRLDALEADDVEASGYNNAYNPGDPLNEGEYSAGDKTATFNETDAEGNPFATPDDPWLVTCDDGPIMRITGAAAAATDAQGRVTVTWDSDHALTGNVKLGVVDPVPEHGHDEYATKSDLESLEAELELLAKTLESGLWEVSDTPMVRPGQMHLAFDQFNVQQNVLTINNEDLDGKTHGWTTVHEGDYVELIDKTDQQNRNIEHDYALFLVTKVEKGNGITTIDLDLYQGQGDCLPEEIFEVRVIDLGDSDLDLDGLDARYVKKSGETEITGTRWSLTKKNNSGTSFIMQQFDGMDHKLYQLPDPEVSQQAANKRYVDTQMNHTHKAGKLGGGQPWRSRSGLPAWNRVVWASSSPGSSAFTPYCSTGNGSYASGSGRLVKDTMILRFRYPEVHCDDFSGNGCIVFSESNDNVDRMMAVFQILYAWSSSSNGYTHVNVAYMWGHYRDTLKWSYDGHTGSNFDSVKLKWGYMMVTAGGYWGPR